MSFENIVNKIKKFFRIYTDVEVIIADIAGNIHYTDINSDSFLISLSKFIINRGPTFAIGDYYYATDVPGVMLFKTSPNSIVVLQTKDKRGILLFFMDILEEIGLEIDLLLGKVEEIKPINIEINNLYENYSDKKYFEKREIPLFNIVATPRSPNWHERLNEEYEKIGLLYQYKTFNNFIIYRYSENNRAFRCQLEGIHFDIRLSLQYPFVMPIADNYYFGNWFAPAGDHKNACFGILKNRWREDGRFGIAHFIQLLGYYTSIAKAQKLKFDLRPPRGVAILSY